MCSQRNYFYKFQTKSQTPQANTVLVNPQNNNNLKIQLLFGFLIFAAINAWLGMLLYMLYK